MDDQAKMLMSRVEDDGDELDLRRSSGKTSVDLFETRPTPHQFDLHHAVDCANCLCRQVRTDCIVLS